MIGAAETVEFLDPRPVGLIWGIGAVGQAALDKAGIRTFADLRRWDRQDLHARFGSMGDRLWHLARGQDHRRVSRNAPMKSLSSETTFFEDTSDPDLLDGHIWRLAEKVSDRLKAKRIAGRVVVLKLKRADFTLISRRRSLEDATQLTDRIYRAAKAMFDQVPQGKPYRLLGVGVSDMVAEDHADRSGNLLDPQEAARIKAERASDEIRRKFGADAIVKGRSLR